MGHILQNYKSASAKVLNLSDFKGKVVIIDFWATWCPPCRRAIPDLVELKKEMGDDIEIIGISLDAISRGTEAQLPGFMKSNGINYPIVNGTEEVTQLYGGIRSIPTSFVISANGKIVNHYTGGIPTETYKKDIKKGQDPKFGSDAVTAPNFTLSVVE